MYNTVCEDCGKNGKNLGKTMDKSKAITVLMGLERSIGNAESQEAMALDIAIDALEDLVDKEEGFSVDKIANSLAKALIDKSVSRIDNGEKFELRSYVLAISDATDILPQIMPIPGPCKGGQNEND